METGHGTGTDSSQEDSAQRTAHEEQILGASRAWSEAYYTADWKTLDGLELTDLTIVNPDGTIWVKEDLRAGGSASSGRVLSYQKAFSAVRLMGDVAILVGRLNPEGKNAGSILAFSEVWVEQAGVWLVAAAHFSVLQDPGDQ